MEYKIELAAGSINLLNKEWFVKSSSTHFLSFHESTQEQNPIFSLLESNKAKIIEEGLRFCSEITQQDKRPDFLTLTEEIINAETLVHGKIYPYNYLKLVLSKDPEGLGFFVVHSVFNDKMLPKKPKSIGGIEVKRYRLNKGDIKESK